MSIPYLPLFVADYELDTGHLSFEENGVYMRLLMLCWRTPECSIPNDPEWVSKRLRIDGETFERSVLPVLGEFFKVSKGRFFNPRLLEEWTRINETSKRRQKAGEKGGRPTKPLILNETNESRALPERKQKESPALHLELEPDKKEDTSLRSVSPAAPKPKKTRLSNEWELPKIYSDWALERGLPRERILVEAEKMRNWSINAGTNGLKSDWFAAWKNWVQKAIDELPRQRGSPSGSLRGLAAVEENLRLEIENGQRSDGQESADRETDAGFPFLAISNHRG
jgi:uncharacterized protein YdaU (DUF1376 family)